MRYFYADIDFSGYTRVMTLRVTRFTTTNRVLQLLYTLFIIFNI